MPESGTTQLQLTPAERLDEVYRTVDSRPLLTAAELNALYEPDINMARGDDAMSHLERSLKKHHFGTYFRRFFFGSRGSGKSTEMSRLLDEVSSLFRGVRVNVTRELNAALFEPYEIVLAIALSLSREMARVVAESASEVDVDPNTLYNLQEWFVKAEYTTTRVLEKTAEGKFEVKGEGSYLQKFIPFTISASRGVRSTSAAKEETKEARQKLYGDLVDAANALFAECNELLGACFGDQREWIIIIEELDKGTPHDVLKRLLFENGYVFKDLNVHLICTLPIGVRFGAQSKELSLSTCQMFDTPVYDKNLEPHPLGRRSLQNALERRVKPGLFGDGVMKRAIVASGGNLRLLFEMVTYAADRAAARRESEGQADPEAGPIILADLERAINQARMGFRYALGEDPLGESKVTWEQKRQRLKEIYDQLPGHDKPNDVLNDLLVGQSVQAFNGEGRYAVHPIVVDLLKDDPVFNPDKEELKGGLLS